MEQEASTRLCAHGRPNIKINPELVLVPRMLRMHRVRGVVVRLHKAAVASSAARAYGRGEQMLIYGLVMKT